MGGSIRLPAPTGGVRLAEDADGVLLAGTDGGLRLAGWKPGPLATAGGRIEGPVWTLHRDRGRVVRHPGRALPSPTESSNVSPSPRASPGGVSAILGTRNGQLGSARRWRARSVCRWAGSRGSPPGTGCRMMRSSRCSRTGKAASGWEPERRTQPVPRADSHHLHHA